MGSGHKNRRGGGNTSRHGPARQNNRFVPARGMPVGSGATQPQTQATSGGNGYHSAPEAGWPAEPLRAEDDAAFVVEQTEGDGEDVTADVPAEIDVTQVEIVESMTETYVSDVPAEPADEPAGPPSAQPAAGSAAEPPARTSRFERFSRLEPPGRSLKGEPPARADHDEAEPGPRADVRGDVGPLIDSLKALFERDRGVATSNGSTRCGLCYLHFPLAELEYREQEGYYVCVACKQGLGRATVPMVRRQQK